MAYILEKGSFFRNNSERHFIGKILGVLIDEISGKIMYHGALHDVHLHMPHFLKAQQRHMHDPNGFSFIALAFDAEQMVLGNFIKIDQAIDQKDGKRLLWLMRDGRTMTNIEDQDITENSSEEDFEIEHEGHIPQ